MWPGMNAKSQSHDATRTLDQRRRRFEELYAENQGRVFGYVLRRTDHADDAADLIAETFLTAWRRLDDIPAGDEARLWLYGVARRVLANRRRGDRRRYELAARLRIELASAHGPLEYTGELAEVAAAFRRLADGDREVLALEGWEGLDPAGIAAVLGCSRNAARIRLHRARRRLSAELAGGVSGAQPTGSRVVNGEAT
jgi:RNA polymerase sigma factor (sigma-70 family)